MSHKLIKKILRFIPLIIAILFVLYIAICYSVIDFSLSIFIVFLGIIVLNILLFYVITHPIDRKERGPSFIHTFIVVSYIVCMGSLIIMTLCNIFSKKYVLPNKQKFNYMIVFGAGINVDDNQNYVINKRIEKAIEYAKKDPSIKFVLSGSKGKNDLMSEANYMRDYMVKSGVNEDKILLDLFANNTYENIDNSLYIIQQDILKRNKYESFISRPFDTKRDEFDLGLINIGFISSDFHIWRINMMALKKGIRKPYDVPVSTIPFFYIYYYIRENLSVFKAYALGQI